MALERKDLRIKVDPELLDMIRILADVDGVEIGEMCEGILVAQVQKLITRAMVVSERITRQGLAGNGGDYRGRPGSGGE